MSRRERTRPPFVATCLLAAVAMVGVSACSSDDDGSTPEEEPPAESVDTDTTPAEAATTSDVDAGIDEAPGSTVQSSTDDSSMTEEESTDAESTPPQLQSFVDDAQTLCDALDEDEIRSIVGDFVELRPDDLFQDDRNLCQPFGERFAVAGIWVFADGAEQDSLHQFAADPYEPCQVNGYDGLCQTHTGDPESFNGWPTVSLRVGSMAVEFSTPDPAVARELAAAVLDDLGAS